MFGAGMWGRAQGAGLVLGGWALGFETGMCGGVLGSGRVLGLQFIWGG